MKYANHIKQIEIDSLWSGKKHILWTLDPHVNILSGINGVGKSTILNKVFRSVSTNGDLVNHLLKGVHITVEPEDATHIRFDIIRSLDSPVLDSETMNMVDSRIRSALDFQLYHLQRKYLDYQVNLSNRIVELFTNMDPDAQTKAKKIAGDKVHFQDLVDDLFKETGKTIRRDKNEIYFDSLGEIIPCYKLSSGEKQMLIILLSVLVQNHRPYVLFMDEPEVSLHIEWQQRLVGLVRDLNPKAQIILTTHSPAVIMDGWADCVTDVEDIVS